LIGFEDPWWSSCFEARILNGKVDRRVSGICSSGDLMQEPTF